jgi:hypothetical protein
MRVPDRAAGSVALCAALRGGAAPSAAARKPGAADKTLKPYVVAACGAMVSGAYPAGGTRP